MFVMDMLLGIFLDSTLCLSISSLLTLKPFKKCCYH